MEIKEINFQIKIIQLITKIINFKIKILLSIIKGMDFKEMILMVDKLQYNNKVHLNIMITILHPIDIHQTPTKTPKLHQYFLSTKAQTISLQHKSNQ